MNMKKWQSMSADQQAMLSKELNALTDRMWKETAAEDSIAVACNTGGKCDIGKPANMKLVTPSAADLKERDRIANDVILARWAKRCGPECATQWNNTVGKVIGMKATAK